MSYQVLARKWRPRRFVEMVGQEHVLKALINALDEDRLHHAYLFTGTRGVGKTSIARLFAKSLNCEVGVSSEPCGQCSACREIAEGRFVDLIEVDAASRTKVEDTRELLENVQYAPTHGRFKVYLIDEVHMLSSHSFNALLKTLEEPPPHVKFLLATTDPQKLPVTILSRCLQFNLKNLTAERIVHHLKFVLGEETVPFEEPALWLLARSADGSMRDALSLTDQSIAFGAGSVLENDVRAMLGTIDQRLVYRLLEALTAHNPRKLLDSVAELAQFSPDYMNVLGDLISLLHRIAVAQALPDAVDNSMGDQEQVTTLAQHITAEDIQLFYQIALMGRKDLPYVPDAREGLEMVLLRMLAFRPASSKPSAVELNLGEMPAKPIQATDTPPTLSPAPVSDSMRYADEQPPLYDENDIPVDDEYEVNPEKKFEAPLVTDLAQPSVVDTPFDKSLAVVESSPAPSNEAVPAVTVNAVIPTDLAQCKSDDWVLLIGVLGLSGMTASIASNLSLEAVGVQSLTFHYKSEQEAVLDAVQKQRISDAVSDYFANQLQVEFIKAEHSRETPSQYFARLKAERLVDAMAAFEGDEVVKMLVSQFDGIIDKDSIVPIDS